MNGKVIEHQAKNTGSHDLIIQQYPIEQYAEHWDEIGNLKEVDMVGTKIDPLGNITQAYYDQVKAQRAHWPAINQQPGVEMLCIYDVVRESGTYNVLGARIEVNSLLRLEEWEKAATGHIDDQWLLQLIRFGFPLQYLGPPNPSKGVIAPNHKSAKDYGTHIEKFIQNEVENLTIMGPFQSLPFQWANVAPMMTRPKSDPAKRRVIVDYSYPEGGINAMIYKNVLFGTEVNHNLPTVQQAVEIIRSHRFNVLLASVDLERAYRFD